jgi:adenylate cyclase class IV
VQAPRRNIELKATNPDPSASLAVCRTLGAEDHGTIEQRDTYFEVARGGLKLREEQPGRPHLIQFERASEPQQRESRYRIIEVIDSKALCAALAAAIGIRGVVVKRRHLLLWQSVRIHLDEVERRCECEGADAGWRRRALAFRFVSSQLAETVLSEPWCWRPIGRVRSGPAVG